MSRFKRTLKWWHWFLIGLVCFIFAMVTGPIADRHGYGTFPNFVVSLLAEVAWTVCWVIAVIRFGKWVWCLISAKWRFPGVAPKS
jgi:hypothetical protein